LPGKIPIKYAGHADLVDHITVGYTMLDPKITFKDNLEVFEKMDDADVNDRYSVVNDEALQIFVDYHWGNNQRGVFFFQGTYICYALLMISTAFWEGVYITATTFILSIILLISEIYFINRSAQRFIG